ncbi:CGNR zinc finger domain-containing protein [Streptomyces sp. BE147]|uniref:CGNR zinc finger domain-containing protein n=1 Tax=Streptomyces sp. BE147 TaxID=3002524 RepID=UPI002E78F832|nr:CGNR zinc finger domain-containing protein [Streptomyces sp. BE147]MEE1738881.1 CGNR zinc finger domain-containing protein [Streptomyces sp. BE147]
MNERAAAPGALVLIEDLVNTLNIETGADALDTADGRTAYGLTAAEVPAARELREALRGACLAHAGHRPPAGASARPPLDELLAAAPLRVSVDAAGVAALRPVTAASGSTGAAALTARVAEAIAAAAADGTWPRLKACEAENCRWVYYDRSPAGRRRWCSMSVCGARAKMRTYRARRG